MRIVEIPVGTGPEIVEQYASGPFRTTYVLENGRSLARIKEYWARRGGALGIDCMTLTDVAEELAMEEVRNERAAYLHFRHRLRRTKSALAHIGEPERVRALFSFLDRARWVDFSYRELPYSWKPEYPELLRLFEEVRREEDYVGAPEIFTRALEAEAYVKRAYYVFGFFEFTEAERALLEKLDAVSPVTVFRFVPEEPASGVRCIASLDEARMFRHIGDTVREALKDDPAARVAVVAFHEADRYAIESTLEKDGVFVSKCTNVLDTSPVAGELRVFLRFYDEGMEGLLAHLRSRFSRIADGKELARVLESVGADSLRAAQEALSYRWLGEEADRALLSRNLPALRTLYRNRPRTTSDFLDAIESILPTGEADLDEALAEVIPALREGFGADVDAREFEALLSAELPAEETDGVEVLSLAGASGGAYDLLIVYSLDSRFPQREKESGLIHYDNEARLKELGLFADFHRKETDSMRLDHLIASSGRAMLYTIGDQEASAAFTKYAEATGTIDLDQKREAYVQAADLGVDARGFSPAGAAALSAHLQQKSVSTTQIDDFLACPFRFFMDHVLKESAEDRGRRRFIERGNLYHKVLESYFAGTCHQEDIPDRVRAYFDAHLADLLPTYMAPYYKARFVEFVGAAAQNEEERLRSADKNGGFAPAFFETDFTLPFGAYTIRGRIDRIDCDEAANEILIDYKSRGVPAFTEFENHTKLQLYIYAMARMYMGHPVAGLEYVSVEGAKESIMLRNTERIGSYTRLRKVRKTDDAGWQQKIDDAKAAVARALEDMQSGEFPAQPAKESVCTYCQYMPVCRKDEAECD